MMYILYFYDRYFLLILYMTSLLPFIDNEDVGLFQSEIAKQKEFQQTKYNAISIDSSSASIEDIANYNATKQFIINPHQLFVKNFLNPESPYNGLLMFHGLGSGKTLSAIVLCEETRRINNRRIIIVASPNIQQNFKTQFLDESKITFNEDTNRWESLNPITQTLINEINPLNNQISKENLVKDINNLINNYYSFYGYESFSNYVENEFKLKNSFSNILLIVDEFHNIGNTGTTKHTSNILFEFIQKSNDIKLLLMSATPVYNDPREIIYLTNLLNINDKRPMITPNKIFEASGRITEKGEDILKKSLNGYISYVRGDDPFTFPYRIYPNTFNVKKSIESNIYPKHIFNYATHYQKIQYTQLYYVAMSPLQKQIMDILTDELIKVGNLNELELSDFDETNYTTGLGHTKLIQPAQAQIIVFGINDKKQVLVGTKGLKSIVDITEETNPPSYSIRYKPNVEHIFAPENIGKYSTKIKETIDNIRSSNGIVLVYLQYITAGIIPFSLALEEAGYSRYGASNLLNKTINQNIGTYTLITGDVNLESANMNQVFKVLNSQENKRGDIIKVILISQSGSEGIDFKNIRQVHILNPWFNLNRIEQIIGRAVRNNSHINLPFEERNTQIFLHCCYDSDQETLDMYLYRYAESKAINIGKVTKLLKSISVDCILNFNQSKYTQQYFKTNRKTVKQKLSNCSVVDNFIVGDVDFSSACDFSKCEYKCISTDTGTDISNNVTKSWLSYALPIVFSRLLKYFSQCNFFIHQDDVIHILGKDIDQEQYWFALNEIIKPENQILYKFRDCYGRFCRLDNIGPAYIIIPLYPTQQVSIFSPIPMSFDFIKLQLDGKIILSHHSNDVKTNVNIVPNINDIIVASKIAISKNNIYKNIKKNDSFYWEKYTNNINHYLLHINNDVIENVVIHRRLDVLPIKTKLDYAIYILNQDFLYGIWNIIKEYFKQKIIVDEHKTYICLSDKQADSNNNELTVFLLNTENNQWIKTLPYTQSLILIKFHNKIFIRIDMYEYIGIVMAGIFKVITKGKSIKNGSAKCITANKNKRNEYLSYFTNVIINRDLTKDEINYIDTDSCVVIELCSRLSHRFLDPEEAMFYNID
jgi:superfamily II DNA or RNA helicase